MMNDVMNEVDARRRNSNGAPDADFAVGIGVGKLRDKVVEIKPKALLQAALGDHTFACGGSVIR